MAWKFVVSTFFFLAIYGVKAAPDFVPVEFTEGATSTVSEENYVIELTKDNFTSFLHDHPTTLVKFYAPWCGHCKRLVPEYERAAMTLERDGIPLAQVDATRETTLATEQQIRYYPTIKFFMETEVKEYNGERKAAEIIRWVREELSKSIGEVDI